MIHKCFFFQYFIIINFFLEKRIGNSALLNDNEEPPSKKTRDRENSLWTIHDEMVECQNSQPESDISASLPVELI